MNITSKQLFDELHELSKNIKNELSEMLDFDGQLSNFDERTLRLFITLVTDVSEFEKTLELLRKLELHCFDKGPEK